MKPPLILSSVLILLASCHKKSNLPQEEINTLKISFTQSGSTKTFTWTDPDGAGGNNPTIDTIVLDSASSGPGLIQVFQLINGASTEVTGEIASKKEEHQFFFVPANLGTFSIAASDKDANGLPVGLTFGAQTGSPANGLLRVYLSHYDGITKSAAPSPETDIDVTFPVRIK